MGPSLLCQPVSQTLDDPDKCNQDENGRKHQREVKDVYKRQLMDFIGTDSQLTGIVAIGFANEAPAKRPRKPFEEIVEYR